VRCHPCTRHKQDFQVDAELISRMMTSVTNVTLHSRRSSAVARLSELLSPLSENREPALRRPAALRSNSGRNRRALTLKSTRPHCVRKVVRWNVACMLQKGCSFSEQPVLVPDRRTMGARVVLLVVVAWSAAASDPNDEASDAHSEVVDFLMER
jgi:hypothetical protein